MTASIDICALCPSLCRHKCPVAVGTGIESTTPTAIFSTIWSAQSQGRHVDLAARAVDLCTQCGHCEDACGVNQPVLALLAEARTTLQPRPEPWSAPQINGRAKTVAVICTEDDWTANIAQATGRPIASMVTADHLGELHRARTDTADDAIKILSEQFRGRTAITACHTCAEALESASIAVETLDSLIPRRPSVATWRSCRCLPAPGVNTVQRCCGARGPLSTSHPELSDSMAEALVRRLDGNAIYTPDARCAEHLKRAGANVNCPISLLATTTRAEE